jgi:hypothetical protein
MKPPHTYKGFAPLDAIFDSTSGLRDVSWSPGGSIVAAFQPDTRQLVFFDANSVQFKAALGRGNSFLMGIYAWSPDGSTIVISDGGYVTLWMVSRTT